MGEKILVADDDREIVDIICGALRGEGYECLTAANGDEAVKKIDAESVRLVIMDVMMPKINGLMATMAIREKSNIPILMLSAKAEESDRVIGLSMGADDYLVKPFSRAELLARVGALLRRYLKLGSAAEGGTENCIVYHDLALNREKKKFMFSGREIKLTPTEYRIMELLMSHPGRVYSAEEIYGRVWESDAYAVENTVMIHISRLRGKIEINPDKPEYIKVVWGLGYKIERE